MKFFQDLGSLVEERWRDQNYSEAVFPEIAAQALTETAPDKHIDPWEIIRWLNTTAAFPEQRDGEARFGAPPITLFDSPRFHVDVYFWLDGTTAIHQHAFCGAFQVLMGSSLHSHLAFTVRREISQHFVIGETSLKSVELLERGAIKRILAGEKYIHSLFHLDRPSATICVRTHHTYGGAPQYSYYKPSFGVDPFFKDPLTVRRTQAATLLLSIQHPEADNIIGELLSRSDFQTAFLILDLARGHLVGNRLEKSLGLTEGEQRFQSLMETARGRHGELVDLIEPVFEEAQRQQNLIIRRGQITGNEHRFFLALLLNIPDRVKIIDLVRQRFPEQNPIETIIDWVEELGNTKLFGSPEPNVLGIDGLDDAYLFVLQCMLEGLTLEQVKSAFEDEFSNESTAASTNKSEELYYVIRNSMLFKSIFQNSTSAQSATLSTAI